MQITLNKPLDMHLHLREGGMLKVVAPLSAETFVGAVIMPNLQIPVTTPSRIKMYRKEILAETKGHDFEPYLTLFFKDYSEQDLEEAKDDILGIKLYPAGVTTNSEDGVRALEQAEPVLARMEALGIPLMVHGETDGFVLDRERDFHPFYEHFAKTFPKLKIVMEHITTAAAVDVLDRYPNLYATVTLHHLCITLNDVAGGLLQPHLFCKPIAKRPEDREALLQAALAPHPKLMFGSDSAPHPVHRKESCGCAAGVFTAPIALACLAELFEQHGRLDHLQAFVSDHARAIYGVNPPDKTIVLEKTPMDVPQRYGDVVPYRAGETLSWSVVS